MDFFNKDDCGDKANRCIQHWKDANNLIKYIKTDYRLPTGHFHRVETKICNPQSVCLINVY